MMAVGGEMKIAGISTAWAIVKPMPHKEKLMIERMVAQGMDIYRPSECVTVPGKYVRGKWCQEHIRERALFPGYVFVRPEMGNRWRLCDQLYVAHHLDVVLYDTVIHAMREYEVEVRSVERAILLSRIRRISGSRVIRSFADLVTVVVDEPIDTSRMTALFDELTKFANRTRFKFAATFDEYLRTDDVALCRPSVRLPW